MLIVKPEKVGLVCQFVPSLLYSPFVIAVSVMLLMVALACVGAAGAGVNDFNGFLPSVAFSEDDSLAAEVGGQLCIALAVADDEAVREVVGTVHVGGEHGGARLTCGEVVLRETAVDEDIVEGDAFSLKDFQHQVLCGPEVLLWIAGCAEPVLIRNHYESEVGVLAQEAQGTDGSWYEVELLEGIDLLVGRFLQDCAIAVDE